ncbi:hypothetical protein WM15_06215 [Burkholderia ubonensis]|nr:hypothetical protein WM15_06215 [Burkholderia ubonensis]
MKVISSVISGVFVGIFAATAIALIFRSVDSFVQFMPPAALAVGAILLVVACAVGFARGRYQGLIAVAIWILGTGLLLFIGEGSAEAFGGPFKDVALKAIPWTFIASCACAILLNATI